MKTKNQIEKKLEFLRELISNPEAQEEMIMSTKQKAHIRIKINLLEWVLAE